MTKEKYSFLISRKVYASLFLFCVALSANAQKDKFNMNDGASPDGFKPEYTIYIFGGMFLIGIGAYFLLTRLNKDPRKKEGKFDPSKANQHLSTAAKNRYGSSGSKNARRRPPQKKTASVSN